MEEFITAPSLLEILRARGLLRSERWLQILERLAPVRDTPGSTGLSMSIQL